MATLTGSPARRARRDLTPRGMVVHAVAAMAIVAVLDLTDGRLGIGFSVGFVLVVLTAPVAVDVRHLFPAGILPPLLLVGMLLLVAILRPSGIQVDGMPADANALGRTIAGVIDHGVALVVGQVAALAAVFVRIASAP